MNSYKDDSVNPDQTSNIEVIMDVIKNKKINYELVTEIFRCLPKLGILKPIELLDILTLELKKKNLNEYIQNLANINHFNFDKDNCIYHSENQNFRIERFLKKGSYHDIFSGIDTNNDKIIVIRKQREKNKTDLFDSISDFFIHSILSLYQGKILINYKHYRGKLIIPKIISLGVNQSKNKILGIMNIFNGTLLKIINYDKIELEIKLKVIFNCLNQIAYYLEHFQMIFKFNHNDLKINNIFYKSKYKLSELNNENINEIRFFIADFGFSRIKLIHPTSKKKIKIIGGALVNYSRNKKLYSFIPGKDLYFLIHNLYAYSDDKLKEKLYDFKFLFNEFNLELTKGDNWFKLYDDYQDHEEFHPKNFIKTLKNSKYSKYFIELNELVNSDLIENKITLNHFIKKN